MTSHIADTTPPACHGQLPRPALFALAVHIHVQLSIGPASVAICERPRAVSTRTHAIEPGGIAR